MEFNFKEEYVLENDIVKLIPLEINHFENLIEYSINEPELWRFNYGGADGKIKLEKYIENATEQRNKQSQYAFIVYDKKNEKFVGSTRFYNFNWTNRTVEIGYTWYGKEFQATGINKNCKLLMLEFAFEKLDVERVGLAASSLNERSINAMKSIGCTVEGILRNFCLDNYGNRIDAIILSILRKEWFGNVKENLKLKITEKRNANNG